jgi:hypothetical protein
MLEIKALFAQIYVKNEETQKQIAAMVEDFKKVN